MGASVGGVLLLPAPQEKLLQLIGKDQAKLKTLYKKQLPVVSL